MARVRTPGLNWLKKHPAAGGAQCPKYWSRVLDELSARFDERCAYTAMHIGTGTVDHFEPVSRNPKLAYQWSNYRHAVGWVNSKKQATAASGILDPLAIEDGWFELHYPSLHLRITKACPEAFRPAAENTLKVLDLEQGRRVVRHRTRWFEMYLDGDQSVVGLRTLAPLVADMIEREGIRPRKIIPGRVTRRPRSGSNG